MRNKRPSQLGGEGGKTFLPENICVKINKMPEFYMILARKKYFFTSAEGGYVFTSVCLSVG